MENNAIRAKMNNLPYIVAIDFDGTIVEDKYPNIGEPDKELINILIDGRTHGKKIILWTCRDNSTEDRHLDKAVEFCRELGLEFDAVNENIPEVKELFNNDTRKVYADVYIDDKAIFHKFPSDFYQFNGVI